VGDEHLPAGPGEAPRRRAAVYGRSTSLQTSHLEEAGVFVTAPTATLAKVALVTGGAKRVGRAIALRLADAGFDGAFTYLTSHDEAQSLIAEIARKKRRPLAILADLTQPQLAADQIHLPVTIE